jgi:hypothetical protein
MPKRIETSKEMLLNFEAAYEQKSAEQMIQEIQVAIPSIQNSIARAIAEGDQQMANELQVRLESLQNALVQYQQALPREQEEEARREQRKQEDLEDFGTTNFPTPRTRQKRQDRGYVTPEKLKPYLVENPEPAQERNFEAPKEKKKNLSKPRAALEQRVKSIVESLRAEGQEWMNDRVVADAAAADPEVQNILTGFDLRPNVKNVVRPSGDLSEEDYEYTEEELAEWDDERTEDELAQEDADTIAQELGRQEILKAVKKLKKSEKKQLFENQRKKDIVSWMTSPNIAPREVEQDEYVEASEDEDYQQFVANQKAELSGPMGMRKYRDFILNFGAEFEKKKEPAPTQEQWIERYAIPSYNDWLLSQDKDFQNARAREFEIAEQITGKPLTEKQIRNLDSYLNADWYASTEAAQEEAQGAGPSGISSPYALPADLKTFPRMKNIYQEVGDMLREENSEVSDEQIRDVTNMVYDGQIEKKMEQMLQNDPDLRSLLYRLGRKLQPYLNLAPLAAGNLDAATSKKELQSAMASQVWDYIKGLNDEGLKGSWRERRKSLNGSVVERMGKGYRPENVSTLEAAGYASMKRYLTEKTFEYMNRMWQKKRRTQDKDIQETPFEFIAELGDEALDNIFDVFDFDMPSQQGQQDAADAKGVFNVVNAEGASAVPEFASLQKAVMSIAPYALKDAPNAEKQMWDLLYNTGSEFYQGREDFYKGDSNTQKDWEKVAELWEQAYGGFDAFTKGQRPTDKTLGDVYGAMQRRIYKAIQREAGRDQAAASEEALNLQKGAPDAISVPQAPSATGESGAMPDMTAPGGKASPKAPSKTRSLLQSSRIAKIRALLKKNV